MTSGTVAALVSVDETKRVVLSPITPRPWVARAWGRGGTGGAREQKVVSGVYRNRQRVRKIHLLYELLQQRYWLMAFMDTVHNILWWTMCISMDSLHNLSRPAMAIDGHASRSIVVDNYVYCCTYRLSVSPVYCGNNRLRVADKFPILLSPTVSIDIPIPQSIAADNGHR